MKVNKATNQKESPIAALLDRTMKYFGVVARTLSQHTGVSETHISEYKNGHTDITTAILYKILEGMDVQSPGARAYFCALLTGDPSPKKRIAHGSFIEMLDEAFDAYEPTFEEMEEALLLLARKYRLKESDRSILFSSRERHQRTY